MTGAESGTMSLSFSAPLYSTKNVYQTDLYEDPEDDDDLDSYCKISFSVPEKVPPILLRVSF